MPPVLMSFIYRNGWQVEFFDLDRRRTKLPRSARFNTDEGMIAFVKRGNGIPTLEDRNILEMQMRTNHFGEVKLKLSEEQYRTLKKAGRPPPYSLTNLILNLVLCLYLVST